MGSVQLDRPYISVDFHKSIESKLTVGNIGCKTVASKKKPKPGMLIGQKPRQALMGTTSLEHRACAAPWQGEMSTGFTV